MSGYGTTYIVLGLRSNNTILLQQLSTVINYNIAYHIIIFCEKYNHLFAKKFFTRHYRRSIIIHEVFQPFDMIC